MKNYLFNKSNLFFCLIMILTINTKISLADSTKIKEQTFRAQELVIDNFSGILKIDADNRSDILVRIKGAKEDIAAIDLNVRNGKLYVEDQRSLSGGSSTSVVTVGNVTTVVSNGGTASVSIGGREFSSGNNRPTLEISVLVPVGIPLELSSLNGNCHVGNTNSQVKLSISSGDCKLGKINKSELSVQGSGNIEANQVTGNLNVNINGSGNIIIHNGQVNHLEAVLDGSGQIDLGVHAQEATISLMGAGNIRVTEVKSQPQVNISGVGNVEVGNW